MTNKTPTQEFDFWRENVEETLTDLARQGEFTKGFGPMSRADFQKVEAWKATVTSVNVKITRDTDNGVYIHVSPLKKTAGKQARRKAKRLSDEPIAPPARLRVVKGSVVSEDEVSDVQEHFAQLGREIA